MSQTALKYELNEPATVAETIDGEAVVINLDKGIYFSIRGRSMPSRRIALARTELRASSGTV